jgi:hypothetical protein
MEDPRDEFVLRGGLSTRPREVIGSGYMERFAKEALVSAVEQVSAGYVRMNVEHLSYLPPIGHWHRAEVEDDDEGHSELVMYGHYLPFRRASDSVLSDGPSTAEPGPDHISGATIEIEPRNFEPEVWEDLVEEPPLPVRQHAARSVLPPLIWVLSVPVTWGVTKFMGSFLEKLGDAAGEGLAYWIKNQTARARESSRDSMVEVQFEIAPNLTVSAFIPFNAGTRAAVEELREGLDGLGPVASFAGWMTGDDHPTEVRLVAFFYKDGVWNLGWWSSPDAAYITSWFEKNYPDPKRFLDRPLLAIQDEGPEAPRQLILPADYDQSTEKWS